MRFPLLALLTLASCAGLPSEDPAATGPPAPAVLVDVPISRQPFEQVHCNWKHRLDQPYVFLEHRGDYRSVGATVHSLEGMVRGLGIRTTGPLFALYFDDPGSVPVDELRARVCMPVETVGTPRGSLAFDVLPSTTVAYAVVAGPYPEIPRAYPGLFAYLQKFGWEPAGPVREIYLNSSSASRPEELLTEVQVPWRATR